MLFIEHIKCPSPNLFMDSVTVRSYFGNSRYPLDPFYGGFKGSWLLSYENYDCINNTIWTLIPVCILINIALRSTWNIMGGKGCKDNSLIYTDIDMHIAEPVTILSSLPRSRFKRMELVLVHTTAPVCWSFRRGSKWPDTLMVRCVSTLTTPDSSAQCMSG